MVAAAIINRPARHSKEEVTHTNNKVINITTISIIAEITETTTLIMLRASKIKGPMVAVTRSQTIISLFPRTKLTDKSYLLLRREAEATILVLMLS